MFDRKRIQHRAVRSEGICSRPVETFSLAELIEVKRDAYDAIALKMDIESAEYEIVEEIVGKGAHRKLDAIYVGISVAVHDGSRMHGETFRRTEDPELA